MENNYARVRIANSSLALPLVVLLVIAIGIWLTVPQVIAPAHAQTASIQISPQVLPDGVVGTYYSQTITVSPGVNDLFTWTLNAGSLPPGLVLDISTRNPVITISGTPTTAGQFRFTVAVTNNATAAATQEYIVNINNQFAPATTGTIITTTTTLQLQIRLNELQAELQQLIAIFARVSGGTVLGTSTIVSSSMTGLSVGSTTFYRDLTIGSKGPDVQALQRFLNQRGFLVATTGPGSIGNETQIFGPGTKAALMAWQLAQGISASGYFGPISRARASGGASTGTSAGNGISAPPASGGSGTGY